jgi:hypothetical protein
MVVTLSRFEHGRRSSTGNASSVSSSSSIRSSSIRSSSIRSSSSKSLRGTEGPSSGMATDPFQFDRLPSKIQRHSFSAAERLRIAKESRLTSVSSRPRKNKKQPIPYYSHQIATDYAMAALEDTAGKPRQRSDSYLSKTDKDGDDDDSKFFQSKPIQGRSMSVICDPADEQLHRYLQQQRFFQMPSEIEPAPPTVSARSAAWHEMQQANHDQELRMKLKIYISNTEKFDEAVEFGFSKSSATTVLAGTSPSSSAADDPHPTSPVSKNKWEFFQEAAATSTEDVLSPDKGEQKDLLPQMHYAMADFTDRDMTLKLSMVPHRYRIQSLNDGTKIAHPMLQSTSPDLSKEDFFQQPMPPTSWWKRFNR